MKTRRFTLLFNKGYDNMVVDDSIHHRGRGMEVLPNGMRRIDRKTADMTIPLWIW